MCIFPSTAGRFGGRELLGESWANSLYSWPQRGRQIGVVTSADGFSSCGLRIDLCRRQGKSPVSTKTVCRRSASASRWVFQNGALFDSLSVRENIAFPLRERGGLAEDQVQQIVNQLIGLVGAEDVADNLPASLSTGRRRAVAIARALAAQPEVVLYDEPTTMVDPIIARRLGGIIQRLKRQLGFTSIVVTHDMRFAERLADLVLFLDQGRARFFGPLSEFVASAIRISSNFLPWMRIDCHCDKPLSTSNTSALE